MFSHFGHGLFRAPTMDAYTASSVHTTSGIRTTRTTRLVHGIEIFEWRYRSFLEEYTGLFEFVHGIY